MSDITKIKVNGEPESSYKLFPKNREFEKRAGGNTGSQSGAQPDWNQNDDTQPDYVKNRPFYAEDPVETVLLEEQVVTFTDGCSDASFDFKASPEDINRIKVTWDGTEYICIPQIRVTAIKFGNKFIDSGEYEEDTGEPFYYDGSDFYTESVGDSHQIKVSKISNKVIKIDPHYIPNSNIRNGLEVFSIEEGFKTKAIGIHSHAEGAYTTASGVSSHAEGTYTTASGDNSHVEGRFNIEDTANKYAHIIGNGDTWNRHNCFMVGWDGAIYVQASDNADIMMKLTIKSDGTISSEQVTV